MVREKKSPFSTLKKLGETSALYSSILRVIEWDQETYMPLGSAEVRSSQIELMSGFIHKLNTSKMFENTLEKLIELSTGKIIDNSLSSIEKAATLLWYKEWKKASSLPTSFVKKCAKTFSTSLHAWNAAKENLQFDLFAPHLKKNIELCKKQAELLGYEDHPYDALLDLYEPGMTTARLTPLFVDLKASLVDILHSLERSKSDEPPPLPTSFDPTIQMEVGKDLLKCLGFSTEISRLDQSSHPFSMGIHPKDTRMTTRITRDNLLSHILSVLHESGHGLYNTQLPIEHYGTPLCEPLSFGTDESQSRLWETLIGRGLPFWKFFYPVLQEAFPNELGSFPLSDFYRSINTVTPSCIRVEADEVSYCLHVILRFEIEKALIEGSLDVEDIPSVWNQKMKETLGISPRHDGEGCLQDIHWSIGSFGYFPTYALGNILAAQFYEALRKAEPYLDDQIESGQFAKIRLWLEKNIHRHGRIYPADELIKRVTGESLQTSSYISYLRRKYSGLYETL